MSDDGSGEWTCSKCGSTLSFIGPITKRRVIEDHEYWIHEVPERDRLRAEGRQAEWRLLHNNGPLFDEAFYDGSASLSVLKGSEYIRIAVICVPNVLSAEKALAADALPRM